MHQLLPPSAAMDTDSDSDEDPYEGDWRDNMPSDFRHNPPKSEENDSPKRQRTTAQPASKDLMAWSFADTIPFQHLVWGRVKGDGNCLWRSIAHLTNTQWTEVKRAALALSPTLQDAWCAYFKVQPDR